MKNYITIINEEIENVNLIKQLQKELKNLDDFFFNNNYSSPKWKNNFIELDKQRANAENQAKEIRMKLFNLTGDYYGISKTDKDKAKIKPIGVDKKYDSPYKVPKDVYKWIFKNNSLLTSDASDAVRWSRIINTKNDNRYPNHNMTIYRAVDNHNYDEIREGDWVTTDIKYANQHNNKYFNNKGKIISMNVNGRDVLVSPTGDKEEAIYAPLNYSIDVKL